MWLLALFVIIPMIEIALFILVGGWIGLWPTLGLVVLSAALGMAVLRRQGLRAVNELRGDATQMRDPLSPLAHGALIVLAGGLLMLPGFFSDMLGLLLLVPALREGLIRRLGSKIQMARFQTGQQSAQRPGQHETITVIDGEYYEVGENPPPRGPSGWTRH